MTRFPLPVATLLLLAITLLHGCSSESVETPWRIMLHPDGEHVAIIAKTNEGTKIRLVDWDGKLIGQSVVPVHVVSASFGSDYRRIIASTWQPGLASIVELNLKRDGGYEVGDVVFRTVAPIRFLIEDQDRYIYLQDSTSDSRIGKWFFLSKNSEVPLAMGSKAVRYATYPTKLAGQNFYLNPTADGVFNVFPLDGKRMPAVEALIKGRDLDVIFCAQSDGGRCVGRRTVLDNKGATQFIYLFDSEKVCQIGGKWKNVVEFGISKKGSRLIIFEGGDSKSAGLTSFVDIGSGACSFSMRTF